MANKIKSYQVVHDSNLIRFEGSVNGLIELKWQPIGGLIITTENKKNDLGSYKPTTVYYQAMILPKD